MEKKKNEKTKINKLRFIDRIRFMTSSQSSLTDNLAEGLLKDKYKD